MQGRGLRRVQVRADGAGRQDGDDGVPSHCEEVLLGAFLRTRLPQRTTGHFLKF